jgi:hypothetical protein
MLHYEQSSLGALAPDWGLTGHKGLATSHQCPFVFHNAYSVFPMPSRSTISRLAFLRARKRLVNGKGGVFCALCFLQINSV